MSKEVNELGVMAVEYLASALDVGTAQVHSIYQWVPGSDPLDVGLFWDPHDEGHGDMAKCNLADELLEVFNDDPGYFRPLMPAAITALRKLADQIEAIHAAAPLEDEVWPQREHDRALMESPTTKQAL